MSVEGVGGVLSRILGNLGLGSEMSGWRAVDAWPEVVGPRVAARTRATAFREGTLHVEVEGSSWMQELGYLKGDLLRRIHQQLGSEEVKDVRFTLPRLRRPR